MTTTTSTTNCYFPEIDQVFTSMASNGMILDEEPALQILLFSILFMHAKACSSILFGRPNAVYQSTAWHLEGLLALKLKRFSICQGMVQACSTSCQGRPSSKQRYAASTVPWRKSVLSLLRPFVLAHNQWRAFSPRPHLPRAEALPTIPDWIAGGAFLQGKYNEDSTLLGDSIQ